jgi:hypothetical protein
VQIAKPSILELIAHWPRRRSAMTFASELPAIVIVGVKHPAHIKDVDAARSIV